MSGEAVVISAFATGPIGLGLLAGAGALVAARFVASYLEERRAEANRKMRRQKEEMSEWAQYHAGEQALISRLTAQREKTRTLLDELQLSAPQATGPEATTPIARGFVQAGSGGLELKLSTLFESLPGELLDDAASPMARLMREVKALDEQGSAGRPPSDQALTSLQQAVELTVSQHLDDLQVRASAQQQMLERVEALLSEVIAYRDLTESEVHTREIEALHSHLLGLLSAGEATATSVSVLERKFGELKSVLDEQLERTALRAALEARMMEHFEDLGYRQLSAEAVGESSWEIPGGEQVQVRLSHDLRMAFQLLHERHTDTKQDLCEQELAFFRQQEKRWCKDLHELLSRLNEDGFDLNLQLERDTPGEAVPVVIIEDAQTWEQQDATLNAVRKQELP